MFSAARYETEGEISMRLSSTLIMYNGEPAYVYQTEGFVLKIKMLLGQNTLSVKADDPKIDLTPPRLGYANLGRRSQFIFRSPVRRYKQGCDRHNTRSRHGRLEGEAFHSKEFGEMIMNIYPSFEEILNSSKNPFKQSTAFSREFSLLRSGVLNYKGQGVGEFNGESMVLIPRYAYLNESLEEALKC